MPPGQVASVKDGDADRAAKIASYLGEVLWFFHAHHSGEDELLYPLLLERAAEASEIFSRMESQHGAAAIAIELGVPPPCAAQLPYNVALREYVESQPVGDALDRSGACVVASFVLAGGVLSGKYDDPASTGRMRELLDDARTPTRACLLRQSGRVSNRPRERARRADVFVDAR